MKPSYLGASIGGMYIVFKMVLYFTALQHSSIGRASILVLVILILGGIFYTINQYVRTSQVYDWIAAFKRGVAVSLIAGVVAGVFLYIYYSAIDTGELGYLSVRKIEHYNRQKDLIPPDKLKESLEGLNKAYSPGMFTAATLAAANVLGLIASLTVAFLGRVILKRKSAS